MCPKVKAATAGGIYSPPKAASVDCVLTKGEFGVGLLLELRKGEFGAGTVMGFSEMPNGAPNPAKTAIPPVKIGDQVKSVNGVECNSANDMTEEVNKSDSKLTLTVQRSQPVQLMHWLV